MTQTETLELLVATLQQANSSQSESIERLTRQNEQLQNKLQELLAQVAWLNRQLFGRKSEKLAHLDPHFILTSCSRIICKRSKKEFPLIHPSVNFLSTSGLLNLENTPLCICCVSNGQIISRTSVSLSIDNSLSVLA